MRLPCYCAISRTLGAICGPARPFHQLSRLPGRITRTALPAEFNVDITAVVSTRNRGSAVVKAVESILDNDHVNFKLIVIDQSDDNATGDALARFFDRPQFVYRHSDTRGASAGRNEGIESSQSEIVALTDDDCSVPPDWLRSLHEAIGKDRRIGVAFGNVHAGEHDRTRGFIPAYCCREPCLVTTIRKKHRIEGIGACMVIRRSVWSELHGFDDSLGPGGRFKSAEELDFAIRALLAGHSLYATPAASVIHWGFRTWAEGRRLIAEYLYGLGATFAKLVRCGHWQVVFLAWQLAVRWTFAGPVVDLGHKPPRSLRLWAFLNGFGTGVVSAVDCEKGHYRIAKPGSTD